MILGVLAIVVGLIVTAALLLYEYDRDHVREAMRELAAIFSRRPR